MNWNVSLRILLLLVVSTSCGMSSSFDQVIERALTEVKPREVMIHVNWASFRGPKILALNRRIVRSLAEKVPTTVPDYSKNKGLIGHRVPKNLNYDPRFSNKFHVILLQEDPRKRHEEQFNTTMTSIFRAPAYMASPKILLLFSKSRPSSRALGRMLEPHQAYLNKIHFAAFDEGPNKPTSPIFPGQWQKVRNSRFRVGVLVWLSFYFHNYGLPLHLQPLLRLYKLWKNFLQATNCSHFVVSRWDRSAGARGLIIQGNLDLLLVQTTIPDNTHLGDFLVIGAEKYVALVAQAKNEKLDSWFRVIP